MLTEELAAREAIRDIVARYNMNGDGGRIAELVALFADDGEFEVDGTLYRGRDALREFFSGIVAGDADVPQIRSLRHHLATQQIDIVATGRATGRVYFAAYTDRGLDHWGLYRDDYRLTDEGWRFARRRVSIDGVTPGGWAVANMARN